MYQIIKVLNNNAILAYHNENERILLGKGIGFGKKQGERFDKIQGAKVYALEAGEDGMLSLTVKDENSFWKQTKYLVVMIN